ncbi:MAG TPA: hypothetical protein VGG12_08725 [Methylovirgula sp.]|jgi:hypothetical protein
MRDVAMRATNRTAPRRAGDPSMWDAFYLGIGFAFLGLAVLYVFACEHL